MSSPAQLVKTRFGDKSKLLDALKPFLGEDLWVGRTNDDKGIARISNAKLVRLFDTFTTVKSKWGTRAKLIDAVVEASGKQKDPGFRTRIEGWPVPRLYDSYKAAAKRAAPKAEKKAEKRAEKPAAKAAEAKADKGAAKKPAAKKSEAPKAAAKKPAPKKSAGKK